MDTVLLKFIFFFVIILFTNHSIAQEAKLVSDSINKGLKISTSGVQNPSTTQSVKTYIYHIPLKGDPAKDSANQTNLRSVSFGQDTPAVEKDSSLKSLKSNSVKKGAASDTTKASVKLVNKIAEHTATPLKTAKQVDTVYLLEVVKPQITQSAITFDAGQVFSTFKFIDNQGNIKKFSNNITGCFSLGYHYIPKNGFFFYANMGMRKGGASQVYDGVNVNWNMQYADADIGIGYVLNKRQLKPYFSAAPYFGYMLKGDQTIGINSLDIKQEKSMKTTDFGLIFSPGLKIALSSYVACYAEYKYILGLENIETTTGQKTYNRAYSFNLGVAITIEKRKLSIPTMLLKNGHTMKNYLKNKE